MIDEPTTSTLDAADPASPAAPPAGPRRPARRRHWLLAAAAVVALALAAAGGWALGDGGADDDGLADARDVAGRFAAAYLTFDADSVDRAGDQLLSLATERFAREFETTRLPGVEALFAESGTATVAEVTDVFATAAVDDRVQALVVVDVDATGPEGSQRLVNLSFVLELVEADGRWRVDAVTPLPIPQVVGDEGTTGTTTTAPATAPPATTAPTTTAP